MIRREIAIFLVVGSLTVAVDFVTYRALIFIELMNVDWSKGMGFVIGTMFAYFANRFWTFGHQEHSSGSVWRFIVLYSLTLAVNVLSNGLALEEMNGSIAAVPLAFLLATGISATLNFLGMKYFVFSTGMTLLGSSKQHDEGRMGSDESV